MFGIVLTGSTGFTPRLQLTQYCADCKNCLASDFSTWALLKCFLHFSNFSFQFLRISTKIYYGTVAFTERNSAKVLKSYHPKAFQWRTSIRGE